MTALAITLTGLTAVGAVLAVTGAWASRKEEEVFGVSVSVVGATARIAAAAVDSAGLAAADACPVPVDSALGPGSDRVAEISVADVPEPAEVDLFFFFFFGGSFVSEAVPAFEVGSVLSVDPGVPAAVVPVPVPEPSALPVEDVADPDGAGEPLSAAATPAPVSRPADTPAVNRPALTHLDDRRTPDSPSHTRLTRS
ncbi:hypothetical protein [Mycolicibacterium fluoranthenivorans]|uniref:hypothetical protein n=1 Tax=Mycolicibacterium fluoranthenivorans TaxID=258505 RepID=UPI000B87D08D|nr:hypothetical protein [Mycolicibacterium fluoranthenivorans]